MDAYRGMVAKKEMCRIVNDSLSKQKDNTHLDECIEVGRKLMSIPIYACKEEQSIDGFDIFGDGLMWFTREE